MQSTNHIVMVRPRAFSSNLETAETNEFQDTALRDQTDLQSRALDQFDRAVVVLREHGVDVIVIEDTDEPIKPDAIFPNNWMTTHRDGTCVLYPMQARSRQIERRPEVFDLLHKQEHFELRKVSDLSGFEHAQKYLEGTGSLVLDRVNRKAFACLAPRTDIEVLNEFCHQMDYRPVVFQANGPSGKAIYHTNVMMCVGTGYAIVCLDSIVEGRDLVESALKPLEVIAISLEQVEQFAGNMLELRAPSGQRLLVMSARAEASLSEQQKLAIAPFAQIVSCDVSLIEDASGGSIRCMMAEIFLPKRI